MYRHTYTYIHTCTHRGWRSPAKYRIRLEYLLLLQGKTNSRVYIYIYIYIYILYTHTHIHAYTHNTHTCRGWRNPAKYRNQTGVSVIAASKDIVTEYPNGTTHTIKGDSEYIHTYIYIYIYIYIYAYTDIRMYIHRYVSKDIVTEYPNGTTNNIKKDSQYIVFFVFVCVCIHILCVCVYIYIYIYIYGHTHNIHTHTVIGACNHVDAHIDPAYAEEDDEDGPAPRGLKQVESVAHATPEDVLDWFPTPVADHFEFWYAIWFVCSVLLFMCVYVCV
jgi:hypothetical protein